MGNSTNISIEEFREVNRMLTLHTLFRCFDASKTSGKTRRFHLCRANPPRLLVCIRQEMLLQKLLNKRRKALNNTNLNSRRTNSSPRPIEGKTLDIKSRLCSPLKAGHSRQCPRAEYLSRSSTNFVYGFEKGAMIQNNSI